MPSDERFPDGTLLFSVTFDVQKFATDMNNDLKITSESENKLYLQFIQKSSKSQFQQKNQENIWSCISFWTILMYHKPDLKIISVSYLTHNSVVKNTFKELETKLTKQHVLSAKIRIFLPRAVLITIYQDPSGYRNILNNKDNYKTSMRKSNQFNEMFLLPLLKEYG